jgi:uncharacterized membrane protein
MRRVDFERRGQVLELRLDLSNGVTAAMDKDTARLEAFSDGVFAIAITLLILEVKVPELTGEVAEGQLFTSLMRLWPSLLALVFSFFVILIIWINHHELVRWVRGYDHKFLFANGLVLMLVTFVPFPTAVVARYLGTGAGSAAVAFYCGTFLAIALAFNALFYSIAYKRRLLRPEISDEVVARVRFAYTSGPIVYATSVALSFWHAAAGLIVCASLWLLWARLCYQPFRSGEPPAPSTC